MTREEEISDDVSFDTAWYMHDAIMIQTWYKHDASAHMTQHAKQFQLPFQEHVLLLIYCTLEMYTTHITTHFNGATISGNQTLNDECA